MPRTHLTDAARRRAAKTGDSYAKALQALTRFDAPAAEREEHNPPGLDWSPLFGVEVTFANHHYTVRGVVLPPDGTRPGNDWLRVAITHPDGADPAEVTYLHAQHWRIDPMPDRVDDRFRPSRRRTRSARGLPLYRSEDCPFTALATRTMLRRQHRKHPAPDQAPVAEYYAYRDSVDLFAIDDTEPMTALSPRRKAAWHHARTCARCGHEQKTPLNTAPDEQRYCASCWSPAASEWWTRHLDQAQHHATAWARDVLADPNAVLATTAGALFRRIHLTHIATGDTLHSLIVAPVGDVGAFIDDDDPRWNDCTPLSDVAEIMTRLASRRILSWDSGLRPVAQRLIAADLLAPPERADATRPWTRAEG